MVVSVCGEETPAGGIWMGGEAVSIVRLSVVMSRAHAPKPIVHFVKLINVWSPFPTSVQNEIST